MLPYRYARDYVRGREIIQVGIDIFPDLLFLRYSPGFRKRDVIFLTDRHCFGRAGAVYTLRTQGSYFLQDSLLVNLPGIDLFLPELSILCVW